MLFANRLKQIRTEANLSQTQLSFMAEIATYQISKLERCVIAPYPKEMIKLAIALKRHPKEIFPNNWDDKYESRYLQALEAKKTE